MAAMDQVIDQKQSRPLRKIQVLFAHQPLAVRVSLFLFGLLLLCDLFVLGLLLDWPQRITPVVVRVPVWGEQARSWVEQRLYGGGLAFVPVAEDTATPQPSSTSTLTPRFEQATQAPAETQPEPTGTATPVMTDWSPQEPAETLPPEPTATDAPTPEPAPADPAPSEPPAGQVEIPDAETVEEENLPDSAMVEGVSGVYQSLPLSCESRSAVDWARFFGVQINEMDFQYSLPFTDNPETGFVGDPRQLAGGIPPYSYGVHAEPVAELLRAYGVQAVAYRWYSYDDLRRQIANGRPVIVWVVGSVWEGTGVPYTASDGRTTTVAALEHTVMIVGYTPEAVVVQDGGGRYMVPVERFMRSWGVLEYLAVAAE